MSYQRTTCTFCNGTGKLSETQTADLVRPEEVQAVIVEECELAGLEIGDVVGPRRFFRLVETRHRIINRLRVDFGLPLATIGFYMGRDHSSIHHHLGGDCKCLPGWKRDETPRPFVRAL